jgi:hypothetical protein
VKSRDNIALHPIMAEMVKIIADQIRAFADGLEGRDVNGDDARATLGAVVAVMATWGTSPIPREAIHAFVDRAIDEAVHGEQRRKGGAL